MKKILILAIVAGAFGMVSCKKDRTCSCTGAIKIDIPLNKSTKKDATDACDAAEKTYSAAGATTCELK
ncbi:MAG: hypothetical protein KA198_00365 [Chitinophagaceae bacterium]|nr:hypothetical protein [Chitinophagaceae bacterium]